MAAWTVEDDVYGYIDGLVQDCSNVSSSALAMELLQSTTKLLIYEGIPRCLTLAVPVCVMVDCVIDDSMHLLALEMNLLLDLFDSLLYDQSYHLRTDQYFSIYLKAIQDEVSRYIY